tara:strand:+ start:3511 stop:3999 length:489 start_codon:yes stop_codon:yes gene_type:complete
VKIKIRYFLLLTALLTGQNKLFWDGYDWQQMTRENAGMPKQEYLVKSSYVNGLLDGRLYDYFKTWDVDSTLAFDLYDESIDYLKTSEIIRAVDYFYDDPTNLYLPISSAILIVNMIAQRQPQELIESYILASKKWINGLMLEYENQDQVKLMDDKINTQRKK